MQPHVVPAESIGHRARFAWLAGALAITIAGALALGNARAEHTTSAARGSRVELGMKRCGGSHARHEGRRLEREARRAEREARQAAREAQREARQAARDAERQARDEARAARHAEREARRAEREALRDIARQARQTLIEIRNP